MADGERSGSHSHETQHPQQIWPRRTAACNGCRARKQKCGGERPTCVRCRTMNQDCEWPKQQKRGPAKGYTEALEARLVETESILLGCLSTISDDNLHAVLSQAFQLALERQTSLSMGLPKSSTVQRKAVIDYWGRFPLTSPVGVSHWYHDRAESRDAIRTSSQMWPEDVSQSTETVARINVREEPTSHNGEPFDMNLDELEPEDISQSTETAARINVREEPTSHNGEPFDVNVDELEPEDISQSTETAARINVREEPTSHNGEPFDMNVNELEPLQNYHTAGNIGNDPHDSKVYEEQFDQYKGTQTTANQPSWPDDPLRGSVAGTPHSRSSIINNTVDRGLGLPAEFQRAFLW